MLYKIDSDNKKAGAGMKRAAIYIAAVFVCILIGLSSRYTSIYPKILQVHLGDAVWASMIYFGCKLILTNDKKLPAILYPLLFCCFIEFSQTYQANWIVNIRSTLIGGLILGKGFLWIDLVRYTIGIVIAFCADNFLLKRKTG